MRDFPSPAMHGKAVANFCGCRYTVMPSVAILLCTFNGARFLPAQLSSFADQKFANWRLFVSDDGSRDETLAILSRYERKLGSAPPAIRSGPRQGLVTNFLGLACDPSISGDYYAYSDQDDIWEPDKLSRAVEWLQKLPPHVPAMYCSRTRLIDEQGRERGLSPLFRRKPNFRNAIVQNIAGGNTMVFNEAARGLLIACGNAVHVPLHDWWTYLLTTSAGGEVKYDPVPSIRYRVHPENVIGSNAGWFNRVRRLQMLVDGRFERWTDLNVAALEPFRPRMTPENRALFDVFRRARKRGFIGRQIGFLNAGVYRQTLLGNLGLILAIWTRKI
jgi:glycosyltransferase involved in cell wall biosynthesis